MNRLLVRIVIALAVALVVVVLLRPLVDSIARSMRRLGDGLTTEVAN